MTGDYNRQGQESKKEQNENEYSTGDRRERRLYRITSSW